MFNRIKNIKSNMEYVKQKDQNHLINSEIDKSETYRLIIHLII